MIRGEWGSNIERLNSEQKTLMIRLPLSTSGAQSHCATLEDCEEHASEFWYLRSEAARLFIHQVTSVIYRRLFLSILTPQHFQVGQHVC